MTPTTDPLLFTSTITVGKDQLLLQYAVTNRDRRDVYLLNRLYRTSPKWEMSPDLIYVHLEPQKETVWLNKKLADIPRDRNVLSPVAPFVTPVRVGQTFKEEVHIPVPVQEYREYSPLPPPAAPPRLRTYKWVYFTLGYYWSVEGMKEEIQVIEGQELIVPKAPRGKRLIFGELVTRLQAAVIPVLDPY